MSPRVEIRSLPRFLQYVALEYEEFDFEWFDEIMASTRTHHLVYRQEDENSLEILIGVTHPIEFKVTADPEAIKGIIEKLRQYDFKRARWSWK